jgi:hypothetical protein
MRCASERVDASGGGGLDRMTGLSTAAARSEREGDGKGKKGGGRRDDVTADAWGRLGSDSCAGRSWTAGLLRVGGLRMGRERERAGSLVGGPSRGKKVSLFTLTL